jgi:threonine/homoserine/homoserine lactone efflux protein
MALFLAFIGVSLLVIVTPGPDTAITIRNTLFGGRSGGLFTALGIACGQAIWALATSVGIVALLVASAPLFLALKYAGAAYLVFLGVQALREAFRSAGPELEAPGDRLRRRLTPRAAFRQGVISDLGNPKMAVFFASLLPQFVPSGTPTFSALLALGVLFALMTFAWLALYAAIVAKAGHVLRRPAIRRAIEGVSGALLIGLGLRIAAEQR